MGANISNATSVPETKPRPTFRGITDHKNHHEKKKKASKLQTFKKKLVRAKRQSRSYDYCKLLRDYTSNWTVEELSSLVEDYESSFILKELSAQADAARVQAGTLKEDLAQLFDRQICTDVKLVYKSVCYPVHRAIVSVRCAYFRELLKQYPETQAEVLVEIKTKGVTQHLFRSVLRYLYTGQFNRCDNPGRNDILANLCQEFGTPNLLEHDLRYLLETSEFSDTILVFSTDEEELEEHQEGTSKRVELPCHRALLCARSPFFRTIFSRKSQTRCLEPVLIDESVIPRQYARVLLHCLYLDTVDLSCIVRSCGSTNSLSEVQAMVTGKGRATNYDDAMDIFLIGRFVDFPSLSQGCEDLMIESLSVETLNSVLTWSSKPYGSKYVYRQALQYLNDEFSSIACSSALSALPEKYLMKCVQSDFLQACEVDILAAVVKWGEDRLIKRIEEREPNLLAHTAHSVSKKGVKKRDLNDSELRTILSGFMPFIRTEHIIPLNHDLLLSCIKRGLVRSPPSHMMADEGSIKRHHVWIRHSHSGVYTKPRLFQPFYEEFRNILKEQLAQQPLLGRRPLPTAACSNLSTIPDTLYMLTADHNLPTRDYTDHQVSRLNRHQMTSSSLTSWQTEEEEEEMRSACYSMPDKETLAALQQRESDLLKQASVQKASRHPLADKHSIRHLIQLCAVRELGLPDVSVHVFRLTQAAPAPAAPTAAADTGGRVRSEQQQTSSRRLHHRSRYNTGAKQDHGHGHGQGHGSKAGSGSGSGRSDRTRHSHTSSSSLSSGGEAGRSCTLSSVGEAGRSCTLSSVGEAGRSCTLSSVGEAGRRCTLSSGEAGRRYTLATVGEAGRSCTLSSVGEAGRSCTLSSGGEAGRSCTLSYVGEAGRSCTLSSGGEAGRSCTLSSVGEAGRSCTLSSVGEAGRRYTLASVGEAGRSCTLSSVGEAGRRYTLATVGEAGRSCTFSSGEAKNRKERTMLGTYPRSERRSAALVGKSSADSSRTTPDTSESRSSFKTVTNSNTDDDDDDEDLSPTEGAARARLLNAVTTETRTCGDLSELVPDIAMSTPSIAPSAGLSRLNINEEMDLDLGDGTRKITSVYI